MDKTHLINAVLCGAGNRGAAIYGQFALQNPQRIRFLAVAEPDATRRQAFQEAHQISDDFAFESWEDLLNPELGKIAEVAFIATPDALHYAPAIQALELGYHILLEKPISPSVAECKEIIEMAKSTVHLVQVSHVLRFAPFWQAVKRTIENGEIGEIVDIDHSENVSYWHFGHSYVRGAYHSEKESSPMILAKSCHDLDLIYWILGEKAINAYSIGDLNLYRPESAPKDAPDFCTDGCPHQESCPWYAPRLYYNAEPLKRIGLHSSSSLLRWLTKLVVNGSWVFRLVKKIPKIREFDAWNSWPVTVLSTDLSPAGRRKALPHSRYDKCIYKCGNDVMDHQIASFMFPGGKTATLRVHGLSDLEGREIRIFGTKGALRGWFRANDQKLLVRDFRYSKERIIFKLGIDFSGHGGGDFPLIETFLANVDKMSSEGHPDRENLIKQCTEALESHFMGFAAEKSRKSGERVPMSSIRHE